MCNKIISRQNEFVESRKESDLNNNLVCNLR